MQALPDLSDGTPPRRGGPVLHMDQKSRPRIEFYQRKGVYTHPQNTRSMPKLDPMPENKVATKHGGGRISPPHQITKADLGVMDEYRWTAGIGKRALEMGIKRSTSPLASALVAAENAGSLAAFEDAPKPRFLAQIEEFIEQTMHGLDEDTGADPLGPRLRIFSAAFERVVAGFRIYKPLLSRIKEEYDAAIAASGKLVERQRALEAELAYYRQDIQDVVAEARREYEDKIAVLQAELARWKKEAEASRQREADMVAGVERMRRETEKAKADAKEAMDTSRLLGVSLARYKESAQENEDFKGRYEQAAARLKMLDGSQRLLADQTKQAVDKAADVESEMLRQRKELERVQGEYASLQGAHKKVAARLTATTRERDDMAQRLTPRPDLTVWGWGEKPKREGIEGSFRGRPGPKGKTPLQLAVTPAAAKEAEKPHIPAYLANVFQGLPPGFKIPTTAFVTRLVQEIEKLYSELYALRQKMPCDDPLFVGLGTGPEVPDYLRWEGTIKNRRMPKGDLEELIKAIWKHKQQYGRKKETLGQAMMNYLMQKWRRHELAIDWCYNIVDACKRFPYDADVDIFYKILIGEVDEEVYVASMAMLEELKAHLQAWDAKKTGKMSKDHLRAILRKFFPAKTDERYNEIFDALETDQPNVKIFPYERLFEENEDGDQSAFIETIRAQQVEEREEYIREVQEALLEQTGGEGGKLLTAAKIKETILSIDEQHPMRELDLLLWRVYGRAMQKTGGKLAMPEGSVMSGMSGMSGASKPERKVPDMLTITVNNFMQFFKQNMVKRYTKKPPKVVVQQNDLLSAAPLNAGGPDGSGYPASNASSPRGGGPPSSGMLGTGLSIEIPSGGNLLGAPSMNIGGLSPIAGSPGPASAAASPAHSVFFGAPSPGGARSSLTLPGAPSGGSSPGGLSVPPSPGGGNRTGAVPPGGGW